MKQNSFEEVWHFIEGLEGRTIRTKDRGIANHIIKVTEEGVLRLSDGSREKKCTLVRQKEFKMVWEELVRNGECVAVEKKAWRIVCAILAELPEVGYDIKPVRVYLKNKE